MTDNGDWLLLRTVPDDSGELNSFAIQLDASLATGRMLGGSYRENSLQLKNLLLDYHLHATVTDNQMSGTITDGRIIEKRLRAGGRVGGKLGQGAAQTGFRRGVKADVQRTRQFTAERVLEYVGSAADGLWYSS